MPQMQVIRTGPPTPNPLGAGFRAVGEQVSRQKEREAFNTERRDLIEGERAYAAGQLREQRASDQAQTEQQIQDENKRYVMKTYYGQMVKLLFSGQIPPDKRVEGLNMLTDAYVGEMGPITGETKPHMLNTVVPKIIGNVPVGKDSPVVDNVKKRERLLKKNMEQDVVGKTLSLSQVGTQIGDLLKDFPQSSKPGELTVLQYKALQKQAEEARATLWHAQNPPEGDPDQLTIGKARLKVKTLENQLREAGKPFGVRDPRVSPLRQVKGTSNAFDMANQIRELIKTETDPDEIAALKRMLKTNDIEKMRKALDL